jgi:microcystin degradation protein MlrC
MFPKSKIKLKVRKPAATIWEREACRQCCGDGAEIKLPSGAEVTNCSTGSSSGSLLFTTDFIEKSWLLKKFL